MQERVWLYLVVSSDAQEESLPAQRRWGYEEAARIGAVVDPNGIFEGVATGKHGARTILIDLIGKLNALAKPDRPSRVLMVRLDRTGRMPLDAISAINDLRKLGVVIRTRKDGDLTFARMIDLVGPVFELLQAGFENEVRSDRSRAGYERKRNLGLLVGSKPPYGVARGEDGRAVADPNCAPIVREVFERWANGDSPADLVAWLRAKAPPRIGKGGREIHLDWSLSHVYKMVHLGTYRGVVVDEDLWQRAQARKRKPSRPGPGGRVYPFAGIRCFCGDRLHPRTNTAPTRHVLKDGRVVIYPRKTTSAWYVCQSMKHETGPKFRNFNEARIEEQWQKLLGRLTATRGPWTVEERVVNFEPRIAMMSRRLDGLLTRRERIHTAFEEGAYDARSFRERLEVVDDEMRRLEADIESTKAEYAAQSQRRIDRHRVAELIRLASRTYAAASRERRAEINAAIFAAYGAPMIADGYKISLPDVQIARR